MLKNDLYEINCREPLGMEVFLEEHLNAYIYYQADKEQARVEQLDLLIPIKLKTNP